MNIFAKNKTYLFEELANICTENSLTTVDCLKDENMVSVEKFDNGELGGECLFEFDKVKNGRFILRWSKFAGKTC